MEEDQARRDACRAVEWLTSPEGHATISELLRLHRAAAEERDRARKVSHEDMHRPVTI